MRKIKRMGPVVFSRVAVNDTFQVIQFSQPDFVTDCSLCLAAYSLLCHQFTALIINLAWGGQ